MPTKSQPSRSQSIRDYLTAHPNAMPKDVVAALKARGVLVAPGLVGLIKHSMKRGSSKAMRKAGVAAKTVGRPKAGGVNRSQAVRDYLAAHPNAKPKEILAAMKSKRINVSMSLVNAVKYAKGGHRGARKAASNSLGRPKSGGVNRSQAVRDYLTAHPGAKPKEIMSALKAKGISLSMSLVNAIKYAKRKGSPKSSGRPVGRPPGKRLGRPPAAAKNGDLRAGDLIAAKAFVTRVGGAESARRALDLLAQLS